MNEFIGSYVQLWLNSFILVSELGGAVPETLEKTGIYFLALCIINL